VVALFPIVAAVGRKDWHRPDGIRQIVKDHGLKENSARGLVDNFGKMPKGEEYQRLNSVFVTEYFLKKINEDFEPEHLRNAVAAVTKHLKYYEGVTGSSQHSIRRILQRYRDLTLSRAN
jgi:5-methylcytosine-specific restriction protein A